MQDFQTEQNIKAQFVTSLMEYFKIEEDINLRAHIADLTASIERSQYREFFRRLSAGDMPFKNPFEKISLVARSLLHPQESSTEKRAKYLYDILYELRKSVILQADPQPASERFEQIYISRIKDKKSGEFLLESDDIEVIRNLGKRWIFDNVAGDKSYFLLTVKNEYDKLRAQNTPRLERPKDS